jgi:hypothetical protein
MCTAQLGLHAKHLNSGVVSSSGRGAQLAAGESLPVWCFSPSGAVSVVQMLQPLEARTLLQLQQHVTQQHGAGQAKRPEQPQLLQLQHVPDQQQGQRSLLRQLARLPAAASFENYQRDVLRRAAGPQHGEDEEGELAFNCVDGDLLFGAGTGAAGTATVAAPTAAAAAVEQDGCLLQHLLWQRML